jgi:hypothetical protein
VGVLRITGRFIFSMRIEHSCFGRIEIERCAGLAMRFAENFQQPLAELCALRAQHLPVEQHAVILHSQQHRYQRLLALFI